MKNELPGPILEGGRGCLRKAGVSQADTTERVYHRCKGEELMKDFNF